QSEMLKHFRKTNSLKCRFHSGDVAHILGRPFMLRSYPLSATKKSQRGTRGRANVLARMQSDISVIELFVAQANNYDQGKAAFFSLAESIFGRNIPSLLQQCLPRVFPQVQLPANVNYRPMRDTWVRIDPDHDAVWFSESLIPYPGDTVVYAFLTEAIKCYAPDADAATRQQLLQAGLPNWSAQRDLLADPQSPYAF
ncbi:MAG: hypothetical protein FWC59_02635, partial [Actinomycetia bacterium]|nr:hypothetical protein [Actinomycetes bacterium]